MTLFQYSNPCWYRYELPEAQQTSPLAVTAGVRLYRHWWWGDTGASPPSSWEEEIRLVQTAMGWRVDWVSAPFNEREELNEPHGATTSACSIGRRDP